MWRIRETDAGADAGPELRVRELAHALGFRFRLHRRDLPGTPDLVFPSRRKVVFVHGCLWHPHPGCRLARVPRSGPEHQEPKQGRDRERDAEARAALEAAGWGVLEVWECQTEASEALGMLLEGFLAG